MFRQDCEFSLSETTNFVSWTVVDPPIHDDIPVPLIRRLCHKSIILLVIGIFERAKVWVNVDYCVTFYLT